MYTVSQLSKISGVSVRALQHYHKIGLLDPSEIGENGYRYYDDNKLLELQQILFFKELDFSLSQIGEIMRNPAFSIEESLTRQKRLLLLKIQRLNDIIDLIDRTVNNQKGGNTMSGKEYFEAIDEKKVKEYTQRAKKEYGDEVVNESLQNVKKEYNNDYNKMKREFENWLNSVKNNMDKGGASVEIQNLIDDWYKIINKIFTCDLKTFSGLGFLYRENEEFATNFRKADEKMPEFICDAIQFYCSERNE